MPRPLHGRGDAIRGTLYCAGPKVRPLWPQLKISFAIAVQEDSYQGSCTVAGTLPPWLRGTLYRAGPGLWEVGSRQLRHMADGNRGGEAGGGAPDGIS